MDPSHDNPILRFKTFCWGIGTFLIFTLILAVIAFFNRQPAQSPEEIAGIARYQTKTKFETAQAATLTQESILRAMPTVAESLATFKPVAVKKPEQVVPGSPTAEILARRPSNAAPAAPAEPAARIAPTERTARAARASKHPPSTPAKKPRRH